VKYVLQTQNSEEVKKTCNQGCFTY